MEEKIKKMEQLISEYRGLDRIQAEKEKVSSEIIKRQGEIIKHYQDITDYVIKNLEDYLSGKVDKGILEKTFEILQDLRRK